MSAGTSFTGGSASPGLRFDSRKIGASLLPLQETTAERIKQLKKTYTSLSVLDFIGFSCLAIKFKLLKSIEMLAMFRRSVNLIQFFIGRCC
jgi:hypothetical protein